MRKILISFLLMAMIGFGGSQVFALETNLSGFFRFRGIADNFSASNNFIGTIKDNPQDEMLTDQRLRLKLTSGVNDYLSFTYYGEVDFQWGDSQYEGTPGRNNGGGIGGDTTNVESKNVYIDINVPETSFSTRLGLQGLDDHWDYSFFAADMAGAKFNYKLEKAGVTAGWFKLLEGDFGNTDDVTLWVLQADAAPSVNFKAGVDYYYFQNQGTPGYATFFGTTDIDDILNGGGSWSSTREDMDLHYLGAHSEYRLADVVLNGWAFANFGSVDNLQNNASLPGVTEDVDVQGYAASVKAGTNLGGLKTSFRVLFFSGDDDITDGEADFFVNPLATESFAFAEDGFMIFFPDAYWASVGQYGFAMVDAAWAGYGLWGATLNASYSPKQMEDLYFQGGLAYVSALEDQLAANDPRADRSGKGLGTEVFFRAGYKLVKNLDLSINGAYAWLGDFYDNQGGGTAFDTAGDPDNPYEAYFMANLSF